MIEMFMNECIDSTMGHIPRILAVLLPSDDPRTSWFLHCKNRSIINSLCNLSEVLGIVGINEIELGGLLL